MKEITIYLIFPIIYVIIGGIVVYFITGKLQEKRELEKNKLDLFNSIYSAKGNSSDYYAWKSLCLVPVVFRNNKEVINSYNEYMRFTSISQQISEPEAEYMQRLNKANDNMENAITKMIKAMAVECKLIKKGDELVVDSYYPRWISEENNARRNSHKLIELQLEEYMNRKKEQD